MSPKANTLADWFIKGNLSMLGETTSKSAQRKVRWLIEEKGTEWSTTSWKHKQESPEFSKNNSHAKGLLFT